MGGHALATKHTTGKSSAHRERSLARQDRGAVIGGGEQTSQFTPDAAAGSTVLRAHRATVSVGSQPPNLHAHAAGKGSQPQEAGQNSPWPVPRRVAACGVRGGRN